jgi:crossover junction endodeoxyribonuclease RuvC
MRKRYYFRKDGYMRILGIDPGLAIVGWAVLDSVKGQVYPVAFGAIRTPAHTKVEERLSTIKSDLETIIEKYHPDEMAVEEIFFNTNITTGISVSEARGVILCTAYDKGLKISEYTPLQVKQAVVGYGRAEKHQVIAMVTSILKLKAPPKPDDTADAVAIAICHAQCSGSAMQKYYNN